MYLDMCENLGSKPIFEEIPVNLDDLTIQSQEVIAISNYLPDRWGMGGYEGKDFSNIKDILILHEVSELNWLLYMDLLNVLIDEQIKIVNKKISQGAKSAGK